MQYFSWQSLFFSFLHHCWQSAQIAKVCYTLLVFWNLISYTIWKVSKYGVISGPYFPVFRREITPYFTQCWFSWGNNISEIFQKILLTFQLKWVEKDKIPTGSLKRNGIREFRIYLCLWIFSSLFTSSHWRCSVKKHVLKNFINFIKNTSASVSFLRQSLFFPLRSATLLKKRHRRHRCFLWILQNFQSTFFYRTLTDCFQIFKLTVYFLDILSWHTWFGEASNCAVYQNLTIQFGCRKGLFASWIVWLFIR